jgi:aldehyde dehydrogenase (NAD+)
VAPDYVLAHESIEHAFIERLRAAIREFYGEHPLESADYGRIINQRHLARLSGLLRDGDVVIGGQIVANRLYMSPTVLSNVDPEAPVMTDEIFGPVLPVLRIASVDSGIEFINRRPGCSRSMRSGATSVA